MNIAPKYLSLSKIKNVLQQPTDFIPGQNYNSNVSCGWKKAPYLVYG